MATNKLLQNDGYEIYPAEKISNRDVYGWRIYQQEDNTLFIPYSQRNAKDIKAKKIVLSIKRKREIKFISFWSDIISYIKRLTKRDGIIIQQ